MDCAWCGAWRGALPTPAPMWTSHPGKAGILRMVRGQLLGNTRGVYNWGEGISEDVI
jgi:hypothetical protein